MPYTYLIGWSKHNVFYYGARWAKDCSPNDLWKTYFTSSKHVKKFRDLHGEPDIIQIRKIFEDSKTAKIWEERVLRRMNVINDSRFLNKNVNGKFLKEGPQSKEHISKRIESLKKNGKKKGVIAWTKETHPDYAQRVSEALRGIPKTEEHINNMRNRIQDTMVLQCPHCMKTGDYKNMKRWHMDRCKHNPNRTSDIDAKPITCSVCGFHAIQSPNFYKHHENNCSYVHNPK